MSWIQAIATVVVAGAAVLAYLSNRRLLEATERQVDLGRATLKRQREPRLVPADPDYCRIGDEIETHAGPQVFRTRRVYIGLENAGIGLAIVNEASASTPERGVYNVWPPPAVPSGAQR